MLRTLEGTLDPEGKIRFREKFNLTRPQRVLVTLLDEENVAQDSRAGNLESLLFLLAAPEFRDRPTGSAEELETVVEHNRNAWDE
jgi:hypothetical protein